ncbi:hypothetical protein DL96DRAFT_1623417 [Flagelloscypha sp. PMI_526]|nr:hypothetical protein DL96DRAFT_1623417 [Flagelloscypha sp. PMI_526]
MSSVSIRSAGTELSRLSALGLDVLTEICHFVHDTSRADIFTLILLNQLFYDAALPFTVRECSISFDMSQFEASHVRISFWSEPNNKAAWVLPHIRHFTIFETPSGDNKQDESSILLRISREEKWRPILMLIPSLRNLIQFTFACSQDRLPVELLRALEIAHPHVRLTVKHWGIGRNREPQLGTIVVDPDEQALVHSPLLQDIEKDDTDGYMDVSYAVLRWIVAHSISLESVITHPIITAGCHYGGAALTRHRAEMRLANTFVMPSVIRKKPFKCLHLLHCPCTFISFADFCLEYAELSSLENLQCPFPSPSLITPEAPHQLTALRHLKLKVKPTRLIGPLCSCGKQGCCSSPLKALISRCGPLETLSLISPRSIQKLIRAIGVRHGPTLHSLALLHTPEWHRPIPLSIENISSIAHHCVRLRDLTLTASRDPSLSEFANALGRISSLSKLTLMFPDRPRTMDEKETLSHGFEEQAVLEGNDISEWEITIASHFPVHSSFAIKIFTEILEQGCQLKQLHVEMGDSRVRSTAQQFVVDLDTNGKVNVESHGYVLPENVDVDWKLDPEVPRLKRLQYLWDALIPKGKMPVQLEA